VSGRRVCPCGRAFWHLPPEGQAPARLCLPCAWRALQAELEALPPANRRRRKAAEAPAAVPSGEARP